MNRLKVGIAGYGVVGKRRRDCIDRHPYMRVVAVCDKNFKDAGIFPDQIRYYSDYTQLLKEEIDILLVCLTNDIAADVTIAGLNRGLNVFCEKPPGKDLYDIRRVINVIERNSNLKLMYGFNHRYHESVKEALRIIHSGKLGRIINLRGVYGKSKLITFNQPDWRTRREIAGGGVLLDQGIHIVDLMRLFAGDFVKVHSFVSNDFWGYDVEDNAYALMRTSEGIVGMLHSSATQWRHRFHLDINLERGSIILGGILSGSKSYGAETMTIVTADPDKDSGDPMEQTTRYNKDPSWDEEIAYFADAVLNNKEIKSGSWRDAYQTMRLVYRIYYADSNWRETYSIPNPDDVN
ncbi:Gfo/Idh/MocA family oxidoreductase [Leptospira santarosai]|uniref:Gfo/Idh/MocA family protein n=1 Tax=Leptospira santarosai TaxID=28183 RepID=UPI0002BFE86A|nr:Gfo/Idh/MocA family oxidoreductase [Leptospira santarosai]EMO24023.1 oxidoreductase, NAD-binding domain protein [Leptospira santarosai str. HAI134]MDI7166940.1 Gfo/Idh/MocA family oxidoreductase [Leptospira santarosai]MDI7182264.1 Gfo/Idh/MocA family oxidoreductase [Leptospira santarosai]MDI7184846.1 Gfo/Idh/MocA family oxidoreductase [Leptospira santarosai]MDI7201731.1 Gfo/Idh/MocA family oxidoreductase [Leptospira santarosai]